MESPIPTLIIDALSESCDHSLAGGKAHNLWLLGKRVPTSQVPPWYCVTTEAFTQFVQENNLKDSLSIDSSDVKGSCERVQALLTTCQVSETLRNEVVQKLGEAPFSDGLVAVRSSGTDEDSAAHSFAGQFESYLFQRGEDMVLEALNKCWASCYSERVMRHRLDNGMPTTGLKMAVIVQVMVDSDVSGVAFSRHPLSPITKDTVLVEAVYGLGEGLVSGELEADRYEVSRQDFSVVSELAEKPERFVAKAEGGLRREEVEEGQQNTASLTEEQAVDIAKLLVDLEAAFGTPLDFEWGIENGQLYSLQARPIVTLPPSCFFTGSVTGDPPLLWDNSNIVESYAGVTSPLTFSFISHVYMELIDLPTIIESYKTLDNKNLYKTGDISQMLVCSDDPDTYTPPARGASIDDMTASRKKELYKTFTTNHGITPPMKNVRKRRFRKTKTKKMIDSPEVEKEVKRLLRADTFAVNVTFKVVNDDKQDDSQSVMSDSVSRSQTPGMMVDEDSLLSLPSDYTPDDKSELVRILEEVSCSSSSEESEDEEISVIDEPGGDSEEASELRAAAQDLETQIEEQKLKIQNTPKILRARFETFLDELEKQHRSILDQLSSLN